MGRARWCGSQPCSRSQAGDSLQGGYLQVRAWARARSVHGDVEEARATACMCCRKAYVLFKAPKPQAWNACSQAIWLLSPPPCNLYPESSHHEVAAAYLAVVAGQGHTPHVVLHALKALCGHPAHGTDLRACGLEEAGARMHEGTTTDGVEACLGGCHISAERYGAQRSLPLNPGPQTQKPHFRGGANPKDCNHATAEPAMTGMTRE